jgi:DNA-binding NarL/FixJ family response regulator
VTREKDVNLALALACGKTIKDAAEEVGVCRQTVYRRLTNPRFRHRVANLRGQLMASALGRLADNMTRAADQLCSLLDLDDPKVRLRTARTLLQMGIKLRDSVDTNDRLQDLEAELARKQGVAA